MIDSETSECIHYEPVRGYPATTSIQIPRELISKHPDIEIRNDLLDCSIDICSVEVCSFRCLPFLHSSYLSFKVPSLFQDNFDYSDIRTDFVHGVLTSDLLMKNIHCYVAKDGYAARVKDTRTYASVRYRHHRLFVFNLAYTLRQQGHSISLDLPHGSR